jgi:hypothetical protein
MFVVVHGEMFSLGFWVAIKEVVKIWPFFPEFVEWGRGLRRFFWGGGIAFSLTPLE